MAWAWSRAGFPFRLVTRVGDDDPDVFRDFLARHGIPYLPGSLVGSGPSASIDIVIRPDRQPFMDHFVGGVWDDLTLTDEETEAIDGAARLHAVLVEGAIETVERLGEAGRLDHLQVTADFLGFRHYTVERFAQTMRHVDIGFVGWPGAEDDPTVQGIRDVAHANGKLVVVTLGAARRPGVRRADGRDGRGGSDLPDPGQPHPGDAAPRRGHDRRCGDAFIAAFLASFWQGADVVAARRGGQGRGRRGDRLAATHPRRGVRGRDGRRRSG